MNPTDLPNGNDLSRYAVQACQFLDREAIPYAMTGGLALAFWGYPRTTTDIDLIVLVDQSPHDFWKAGVPNLFLLEPDELTFPHMKVWRALMPASSPNTVVVDLIRVDSSWSAVMMSRRIKATLLGASIYICSAEDIILLKLFSAREKDKEDIRTLVQIRKALLDLNYLEEWASKLGTVNQWKSLQ